MTRNNWGKVLAVSLIAVCCAVLLVLASHRTAAQEGSAGQRAAAPTSNLPTATLTEPAGFSGPIATANGSQQTLRYPANTGTNTLTLQCWTDQAVLMPLTLAPGQAEASFSCTDLFGYTITTINETCTGTAGDCKLTFMP